MRFLTTDQWRARGFLIRRGARSEARDQWGRPLFSEHQVRHRFMREGRRYIDARGNVYYV